MKDDWLKTRSDTRTPGATHATSVGKAPPARGQAARIQFARTSTTLTLDSLRVRHHCLAVGAAGNGIARGRRQNRSLALQAQRSPGACALFANVLSAHGWARAVLPGSGVRRGRGRIGALFRTRPMGRCRTCWGVRRTGHSGFGSNWKRAASAGVWRIGCELLVRDWACVCCVGLPLRSPSERLLPVAPYLIATCSDARRRR